MTINEQISNIGIVPVVVINNADNAVGLARALVSGGLPTAEVTYRTEAAEEAIKRISREVPEILVGAGTITSVEMAKSAVNAGAKYLVSPGLNPKVVQWCTENNVPIFPGVTCPSQIEQAMELGLNTVKFFPAEAAGGIPMLKSFASPYGKMKFMPTGGVSEKNVTEYLGLKNVIACGGSWICPSKLIDNGEYDKIAELCKIAVAKMHGFKLLHVGLNSKDEKEAEESVKLFANMFNLPVADKGMAYFAGDMMEVLKKPFLGENGHIAIGVNNLARAIAYFEARGFKFRKEGYIENVAAYFELEIGGFAIHLRQLGEPPLA